VEIRIMEVKEREGKVLTRIVEGEGATESVRNYSSPATAIAYLNVCAAYYKQVQAAPEDIGAGREVEAEDGGKALLFGTIQGVIAHLSGLVAGVEDDKPKTPEAPVEPAAAEAGEEAPEAPEAPEADAPEAVEPAEGAGVAADGGVEGQGA